MPCTKGVDAYPKARHFRPDVAIVDLMLPDLNGKEVIEQLRADPATAAIHIIVCTAAVTEAPRAALNFAAGATISC